MKNFRYEGGDKMYRTNLHRIFDPWNELFGLDEFFRSWPETTNGYPAVTAWKDEEKAVVEAELPGFEPGDVDISVKGRRLTISGERKAEGLEGQDSYHYKDRWHGSFTRSFELPFEVDDKKVEAQYRHGILTVTLPRAEADKPRKIEVTLN
jgi:HSP20 family protein